MTVRELILNLSMLDPNKKIVIMDADEGPDTLLEIMEILDDLDYVGLSGNYLNRWEPEDSGIVDGK